MNYDLLKNSFINYPFYRQRSYLFKRIFIRLLEVSGNTENNSFYMSNYLIRTLISHNDAENLVSQIIPLISLIVVHIRKFKSYGSENKEWS